MIQRIPVIGRSAWILKSWTKLHDLPNEIVTAGLRDSLCIHYGPKWTACVMFSDGSGTIRTSQDTDRLPPENVTQMMQAVAIMANRQMHHGGHWVVLCIDKNALAMVWRDEDGDTQFCVDFDDEAPRIAHWRAHEYCERAEEAHKAWVERVRMVDRRRQDTIKRAQGEKSKAPHLEH